MPPREVLHLVEMVNACNRVVELVGYRSTDEIRQDRTATEAILWNYTVLGEAAGKVPDDVRLAHPEIPWRRPVELRNRIVHGYWSIDLDILVTTARTALPGLLVQLQALVSDQDPS